MTDAEPITLGVLATTAITGTLGNVTDRHLRSGLRLVLEQVQRGELPRNVDVAIATRRAQMLALKLSLRGYERLPHSSSGASEHHITRPLSGFIHQALGAPKFESLDRSTQATVIKQIEAAFVQPESQDGTVHYRQRAVRRLAEDWTLAEAHSRVRNATDWPRFERLMREGDGRDDVYVVTPAWWDAFRALMAEEIRCDMRLAAIFTQRGLVDILGNRNDLKAVLAQMGNGQEEWVRTIAPALAALRTRPEQLKQNLERFDQIADEVARIGSLIQRAAEASNLGILHSNAGRREEALSTAAEAVACYRELVTRNRDAFLPDLARSLNNLGGLLSETDGVTAAAEALGFYRELVIGNREAFLADLARLLDDLGKRLSGAGRDDEALAGNAETVGLYRELAVKDRDTFLPELAGSLNNLASRLSNAGRCEEALAASAEAVDLGRELVGRGDAEAAALARACGSFGHALRALQRLDEALISFSEGVEVLNPLMTEHGEALAGLYDALVNELIVTTEATGRTQEAAALRAQLNRKSHK